MPLEQRLGELEVVAIPVVECHDDKASRQHAPLDGLGKLQQTDRPETSLEHLEVLRKPPGVDRQAPLVVWTRGDLVIHQDHGRGEAGAMAEARATCASTAGGSSRGLRSRAPRAGHRRPPPSSRRRAQADRSSSRSPEQAGMQR